jgi:hypothetical protein
LLYRAVPAKRLAIFVAALTCTACGRLGFGTGDAGPDAADGHLHTAAGWSIAQLVDLGAGFSYDANDFLDGGTLVRDNAPSYVAALYPPFTAELAVIAGRSVIEIAPDGRMTEHDYRPVSPDGDGPDVPGRITFADFGSGDAALWLTAASLDGGDGLYQIDKRWSLQAENHSNNVYALAFDATGTFDGHNAPGLYFAARTQLERQTPGSATPVIATLPLSINDLVAVGDALYFTVETQAQVQLVRLGPGASYLQTQLTRATSTDLVLAEGPADAGLFAIHDDAELVRIDPASGSFTRIAWTDDATWVWRAACVPRAGHRLAGQMIVIESNRMLGRDRLLVIAPR